MRRISTKLISDVYLIVLRIMNDTAFIPFISISMYKIVFRI